MSGRYGRFSHFAGCECDERFTCRQCLVLASQSRELAPFESPQPRITDPRDVALPEEDRK